MSTTIHPVILCGGSGTRLWPLSRKYYPKQFIDLGGRTLFTDTVRRTAALPDRSGLIIMCNDVHRFLAAAQFQECAMAGQIILEPSQRNTAPAIATAAFAALESEEEPILLVMPSDHSITPEESFIESILQGRLAAEKDMLVTFGVPPDRPERGFGYIISGNRIPGGLEVKRFVEKPSTELASELISAGNCFWNSGIFMFKASIFLSELESHAPEIYEACRLAWRNRRADLDFIRLGAEFESSPDDSIDYAVMEHTKMAAVTPLTANWNDLGSWEAFYQNAPHDQSNNALIGDVLVEDSQNCYLHSTKRLIAALGLSGLAVVETADAVLVADLQKSQQLKKITDRLSKIKRSEIECHVKVYRPWGSYETLVLDDRFQVKRIIVNSGAMLSKQLHHHRAEHWVVVRGIAKVHIDGKEMLLAEDQSTYIPLGAVHRLENPGRIPLEIIEIQTGSYLGEDDIVRLEDTYGR